MLPSMNPIDTLATHSPYLWKVRRDEGLKDTAVSFLISVTCIRNALAISSTPPGDLQTTHNILPFPLPFLSPSGSLSHTHLEALDFHLDRSFLHTANFTFPSSPWFLPARHSLPSLVPRRVPTHQCTHRAKTPNYCPRSKSQVHSTNYLNVLLCFLHYYPNTSSQRWFQRSCPGLFSCESLECRLKAPIAYKVKLNLLRKK